MDDLLLDELLVGSAARSAPSAATQRAPPGAPWRHRASCWRHRHQSGNTLQHRQSRSPGAWFVLLGGVRVLLDDVRHDPWGVRMLRGGSRWRFAVRFRSAGESPASRAARMA